MNSINSVVLSTFDSADLTLSQKIYAEFSAGKVITQFIFDSFAQAFVENKLYTELYKHLETHYTPLYKHIDFELVFTPEGEFFHIRKEESLEEADENATKVQALLLIIARYWADKSLDLDDLAHEQFGLKTKHLEEIQAHEQYERIRMALMPKEDWTGCINYLLNRHFLYKCADGHFVFSSAGMFFIQHHVDKYQAAIE